MDESEVVRAEAATGGESMEPSLLAAQAGRPPSRNF